MKVKSSAPYYFGLSLLSIIYYFFGNFPFSAYEWSTIVDIPFLLRTLDPNYLTHDFYTNSVINSPKLIYAQFVVIFIKLGFTWYNALYFLKICFYVFKYPLLFSILIKINSVWNPKMTQTHKERIKIISLFYVIGFLSFLGGTNLQNGPGGWAAIQHLGIISPMTLSYLFGIAYLHFKFSTTKTFPIVFLMLSTLIHPAIGICIFIIELIFILPLYDKISDNKPILIEATFGVVVPMIIIFYNYQSFLSSYEYIKLYVYDRHPHHYLMSEVLDYHTLKWFGIFIISLCISIWLK